MTKLLDSTLVLCDLDHLLLAGDGNMPQVVRDVLQLFSSRGGRLTVFSQRSPRAVRAVLGGLRLAAPALTCGGTLAYRFSERTGMDVMVLTPGAVSAEAMLGAVCLPVNCTADQLTVAAGCSQMLELVRQARQSVVPADAPVELRLAAGQTTLTDHDTGAAAEFFYGLVRSAEAAS